LSNGTNPASLSNFYYPLLSQALINHHLYLDIEPKPELLTLADPYDPSLNEAYRLHDASLYHGKYYLYFGPTPALCLFVPYRLITHDDFPQKLAVPLFCSAGFLLSVMLFVTILRDSFQPVSLWLKQGCVLSLGMANICPFLIRRPDVYEVAIGCAFAFLQLTFLLFYLAIRNPHSSLRWLILASVCIGASVGARPNYILAAGLFCAFAIGLAWKNSAGNRGSGWIALFSLVPIVLIGLLIAWYNDLRFGNPLEFGQRYQLAGVEMAKISFFRLDNAPYNIWYNFFSPLCSIAKFPFVDAVQPVGPSGNFYALQKVKGIFQLGGNFYGLEKVAGMFQMSPVTVFALTLPLLYTRHAGKPVDRPLLLTLMFLAGSVVAIAGPLMFISGATMRYMVDFVPTFVFLACIMLCHFHFLSRRTRFKRWLFNGFVAMMLLVGCGNGLFLSFTGYYNFLQLGDPNAYAALAEFFHPLECLSKAIGNFSH
jgi:hypothetical protein